MNRIYIIGMLLLFSIGLQGQQLHTDHVHLWGDNMLIGKVMDTIDNSLLRIDIGRDNFIAVPLSLIDRIDKGVEGRLYNNKGRFVKSKGFFFESAIATLAARPFGNFNDEELRVNVSIQASLNYFVKPYLSVGGGISAELYNELMVPVFAQSRIFLPNKVLSPYFNLQIGYGIAAQKVFDREEFDESHGGFMWYPSIGVRLPTKRNTEVHFDMGYKIQHLTYKYDYPDDWWTLLEQERIRYKSFAIKLGLVF